MSKRQIIGRTAVIVLLTTVLTGANTQVNATGESNNPPASALARAIEGPWEPTVTSRDCQTGAPLFSFLALESYIRGGSLIAEGVDTPPNRALGVGTWRHEGGRNFTSTVQFFVYNPDGTPLGRLKASARIRLSADGESFRSLDTGQITDFNGTVLTQICTTRDATRLR